MSLDRFNHEAKLRMLVNGSVREFMDYITQSYLRNDRSESSREQIQQALRVAELAEDKAGPDLQWSADIRQLILNLEDLLCRVIEDEGELKSLHTKRLLRYQAAPDFIIS
jgi:hypothetical protein